MLGLKAGGLCYPQMLARKKYTDQWPMMLNLMPRELLYRMGKMPNNEYDTERSNYHAIHNITLSKEVDQIFFFRGIGSLVKLASIRLANKYLACLVFEACFQWVIVIRFFIHPSLCKN